METLYNILKGMLPNNTLYWTLKGYMTMDIHPSGNVSYVWHTWGGRKFHRLRRPTFTRLVDICDFYSVGIETAIHMAHRNGWKAS